MLSSQPSLLLLMSQNPFLCETCSLALEANDSWILTSLPPSKRVIDSKWVYKVKFNPDGTVEHYKTSLVAKGYTQIEDTDFRETFASVAKLVTLRCLLAIASVRKWEVHQLDVNNALLHGDVTEEVYMRIHNVFPNMGSNMSVDFKNLSTRLLATGIRNSLNPCSQLIFISPPLITPSLLSPGNTSWVFSSMLMM